MKKQEIIIEVIWFEDEEVKYKLSVNNGIVLSTLEYFAYADTFKKFASRLKSFPKESNSIVCYQIGNENEDWAYHLKLKVFCFDSSGATAIEILMNNKEEPPDYINTNFYLFSIPSSINELGNMLESWDPLNDSLFKWESQLE